MPHGARQRIPQNPKRSATADKKDKPSAKRRNTELKASRIVEPSSLLVDRNLCIRVAPSNCVNHSVPRILRAGPARLLREKHSQHETADAGTGITSRESR